MSVAQEKLKELSVRFELLSPYLNERLKRLWAGAEAASLGHGGVAAVARVAGMSVNTVREGREELAQSEPPSSPPRGEFLRQPGAGRPRAEEKDPQLVEALLDLVEPTTRGDPESPLRWTCKSTRDLADELTQAGHPVGRTKVHQLLKEQDFSLQAPRKTKEGGEHPARDAQFCAINETVKEFQQREQPVISVDAKKKELVGEFFNKGREWQPKGHPEEVKVYDFPSEAEGKAVPYGVYDVSANEGWVSVGISADTAEFAVETIGNWWAWMGQPRYEKAEELLILADGGGSNSSRNRLFKWELQRFADETGLRLKVMHYPPGTSKWNKIEHRMFNHISMNWRGRPLTSFGVIVNCIANTKTEAGLSIEAQLDQTIYQKGIKITDAQMKTLVIERDDFHGEWNYTIAPRKVSIN